MAAQSIRTLLIPLFQAIAACFLWGGLFAVPLFLDDFYSMDIVLGRFFFYGVASLIILAYHLFIHKNVSFFKYFKEATLCAVIMNLIHFSGMTLGIRFASAALITIIMGTSPIAITVVTCVMQKDSHLIKTLFWPCLLILIGIIFMNIELINFSVEEFSLSNYLLGLFFGLVALGTWIWFVIYNSHFLQKNSDINANQWTALIGIQTLWLTLAAIAARYYVLGGEHFERFHWEYESGQLFLVSTCILGVFCSWIAFALWSAASPRISPALGGQLSILESIFGLAFVYTIQLQLPSVWEGIGICLILVGVSAGLYLHVHETEGSTETISPQ